MAIESYFYSRSLDLDHFPPWPCSRCGRHSLSIKPESFVRGETLDSRAYRGSQDWDPEGIEERFVCLLVCGTKGCGEVCSVAGTAGYRYYDVGPETDKELPVVLEPHFIEPAPAIFKIPSKCPKEAVEELKAAFSLFWSDPSASLNRVRASIEALLDAEKVQRRAKNKRGKFNALTLHQRIERFFRGDSSTRTKMLAVKWLGNVGSHGRTVTREQLLEAFELVEHILEVLIEKRPQRLDRMAREISKRKGRPPKPLF